MTLPPRVDVENDRFLVNAICNAIGISLVTRIPAEVNASAIHRLTPRSVQRMAHAGIVNMSSFAS